MEILKQEEMVPGCQPNWITSQHSFSQEIPDWQTELHGERESKHR